MTHNDEVFIIISQPQAYVSCNLTLEAICRLTRTRTELNFYCYYLFPFTYSFKAILMSERERRSLGLRTR